MKTTLTTAIVLALALPWSVALAKPRPVPPPTTLSHPEQVCQAYGTFAFNRALDRNNGYPMLYILDASRRYDRQRLSGAEVEAVHDRIIRAVWANPAATPAAIRQTTEAVCLDDADVRAERTQERPAARPSSGAMQRY
jgi:hypothetical protein